jgi:hypothetical protein
MLVEVPFDVGEVFGEKRAPVKGTVNGTPFRGRVAVYGGKYYLGFRKEIRDQARIDAGDEVEIEIDVDTAPRVVEVPEDLARVLNKDKEIAEFFEGLSFTHRKEYVNWVNEAKKQDTRDRRVAKTVEMLRERIKHP